MVLELLQTLCLIGILSLHLAPRFTRKPGEVLDVLTAPLPPCPAGEEKGDWDAYCREQWLLHQEDPHDMRIELDWRKAMGF